MEEEPRLFSLLTTDVCAALSHHILIPSFELFCAADGFHNHQPTSTAPIVPVYAFRDALRQSKLCDRSSSASQQASQSKANNTKENTALVLTTYLLRRRFVNDLVAFAMKQVTEWMKPVEQKKKNNAAKPASSGDDDQHDTVVPLTRRRSEVLLPPSNEDLVAKAVDQLSTVFSPPILSLLSSKDPSKAISFPVFVLAMLELCVFLQEGVQDRHFVSSLVSGVDGPTLLARILDLYYCRCLGNPSASLSPARHHFIASSRPHSATATTSSGMVVKDPAELQAALHDLTSDVAVSVRRAILGQTVQSATSHVNETVEASNEVVRLHPRSQVVISSGESAAVSLSRPGSALVRSRPVSAGMARAASADPYKRNWVHERSSHLKGFHKVVEQSTATAQMQWETHLAPSITKAATTELQKHPQELSRRDMQRLLSSVGEAHLNALKYAQRLRRTVQKSEAVVVQRVGEMNERWKHDAEVAQAICREERQKASRSVLEDAWSSQIMRQRSPSRAFSSAMSHATLSPPPVSRPSTAESRLALLQPHVEKAWKAQTKQLVQHHVDRCTGSRFPSNGPCAAHVEATKNRVAQRITNILYEDRRLCEQHVIHRKNHVVDSLDLPHARLDETKKLASRKTETFNAKWATIQANAALSTSATAKMSHKQRQEMRRELQQQFLQRQRSEPQPQLVDVGTSNESRLDRSGKGPANEHHHVRLSQAPPPDPSFAGEISFDEPQPATAASMAPVSPSLEYGSSSPTRRGSTAQSPPPPPQRSWSPVSATTHRMMDAMYRDLTLLSTEAFERASWKLETV